MSSTNQSVVPDLNILVNQSLFDLNTEPTEEDDTPFEGEIQIIHEDSNLNNENEDIDDPNEEISQPSRSRKELSNNERRSTYEMLLKLSVGGKLKKGTQKMVASIFLVSP